jgi:hypothetical protein
MNVNELELWHRHHQELIREADNKRLARQLRQEHPRRASRPGSRRRMVGLGRAMGF